MSMRKTTVYLPDDLKRELEAASRRSRRSEADLVREGVRLAVARESPRRPRIPLFESARPDLAKRVDELVEGFGERWSRSTPAGRSPGWTAPSVSIAGLQTPWRTSVALARRLRGQRADAPSRNRSSSSAVAAKQAGR